MTRRRWVVFVPAGACGFVLEEVNDGQPEGVRALRVAVPGVSDRIWWPTRSVRDAGVIETILGELELMVRGLPDSL